VKNIYIASALHVWHINPLFHIAVKFAIFRLKIMHFLVKII